MGWISVVGGLASAYLGYKAQKDAQENSLKGFEYLKDNENVTQAQGQGTEAGAAANALLGLGGDQGAAEKAFENFRGSTGYQFRLDEGMRSITGSAAARGLLNSGATLKGMGEYSQNLASSEFNTYLTTLLGKQDQGLNAAYNVASQGTTGGANAAQYARQGAQDIGSGLSMAAGGAYDLYQQGGGGM